MRHDFNLGKPKDLLLIQKFVRRLKGSKRKTDYGQIFEEEGSYHLRSHCYISISTSSLHSKNKLTFIFFIHLKFELFLRKPKALYLLFILQKAYNFVSKITLLKNNKIFYTLYSTQIAELLYSIKGITIHIYICVW